MFDRDRFVEDCIKAAGQGQAAVREVVARAVADSGEVMRGLGEPQHAGITALYRSPAVTILNFVWAPCMSLMPHNHQMYSVVGLYSGREDNVFWRRARSGIEAASARSLGVGDVAALGQETIHSVVNPIGKMSCAIHVYGGDYFNPAGARSQWDHETLAEMPWDLDRIRTTFSEAERRFNAAKRAA